MENTTMNEGALIQQEMTLRDYVRVLFRQKLSIILSILVVMTIVCIGVSLRTPKYEASVKMLVSGEKQVDAPYYKELLAARQMEASLTQSEIAVSNPVLQRVVGAMHLSQKAPDDEKKFASPIKQFLIKLQTKAYYKKLQSMPEEQRDIYAFRRAVDELRANVKVTPVKDTNIFTITVTDYDRVGAAVIANVISRSYVMFDLEQQMAELQLKYGSKHPVVVQLQDNISQMKEGLNGKMLNNAEAIGPASVKIIEQASVPTQPTGKSSKLLILAALFASTFLGIILAFLFEYMDQTIKSPRDLEVNLNIPLLGSIPLHNQKLPLIIEFRLNPKLPKGYVRAFKDLADQVYLLMTTKAFKTLYIATSDSHDGEAKLISNLGYHLAEHRVNKILILDANFREPSIHKYFDIPAGPGVVDVLTAQAPLSKALYTVNTHLSVLQAGETTLNPVTFLDSVKMRGLLDQLKIQFNVILFCCSELKSYQDGYILASIMDQTIFVVSENETRRQIATQEIKSLKDRNVSILGGIINNRTYPIPKFVYERV